MQKIKKCIGMFMFATLWSLPQTGAGYDRELRDLSISDWDCLNRLSGSTTKESIVERNEMKNRFPLDMSGMKVPELTWQAFLKLVRGYDSELQGSQRIDLTKDDRTKLLKLQGRVVSMIGWLVVAYPGPGETCNCGEADHHDWHMELFENPLDHAPDVGDPTGIVCEISPRTEQIVYESGIRIQAVAGYIRQPDQTDESTGHPPHKVRITGYVLWDDEHNQEKDVGETIQSRDDKKYYHPWRQTAWEIHPVFAIDDLGTE